LSDFCSGQDPLYALLEVPDRKLKSVLFSVYQQITTPGKSKPSLVSSSALLNLENGILRSIFNSVGWNELDGFSRKVKPPGWELNTVAWQQQPGPCLRYTTIFMFMWFLHWPPDFFYAGRHFWPRTLHAKLADTYYM
jgi:hypothetical protein